MKVITLEKGAICVPVKAAVESGQDRLVHSATTIWIDVAQPLVYSRSSLSSAKASGTNGPVQRVAPESKICKATKKVSCPELITVFSGDGYALRANDVLSAPPLARRSLIIKVNPAVINQGNRLRP